MALGNGRRMSELFESRMADWSRVEAVVSGSGGGSGARLGPGSLAPAKRRHGTVCVLEVCEREWVHMLRPLGAAAGGGGQEGTVHSRVVSDGVSH